MASTPSFSECLILVFGVAFLLMWVVSDVIEEQMIGKGRRERQRAVKARARAQSRSARASIARVSTGPARLPRAQVHRLS